MFPGLLPRVPFVDSAPGRPPLWPTALASCLPDESSAGSLPLLSVSLFTPLTAAEMAPYMKRLSRGQTVEGEFGSQGATGPGHPGSHCRGPQTAGPCWAAGQAGRFPHGGGREHAGGDRDSRQGRSGLLAGRTGSSLQTKQVGEPLQL